MGLNQAAGQSQIAKPCRIGMAVRNQAGGLGRCRYPDFGESVTLHKACRSMVLLLVPEVPTHFRHRFKSRPGTVCRLFQHRSHSLVHFILILRTSTHTSIDADRFLVIEVENISPPAIRSI